MARLKIKRVYDGSTSQDGYRVLVDRVWSHGMTKEKANVDVWLKSVAPSNELRKWFAHDPTKWDEFRSRYARELDDNPEGLAELIERVRAGSVTLVYSAADRDHNQAVALAEYLESRLE